MRRSKEPKRLVLIGGGVRSGKSAFALVRAQVLGTRRTFIATAEPFDLEMQARVVAHREERGSAFDTLEAPRELVPALGQACRTAQVVVIDCLTLWLSNLLLAGLGPEAIASRVEELERALTGCPAHVVMVSNEVGMGVVPESKLGRQFRDVSGRAHQRLAARADELYFAMMGQILRLRPAPVELLDKAHGRA